MLNEDAPIEAMLMLCKASSQECKALYPTCLICEYEIFCNSLANAYKTLRGLLRKEEQERLETISERMDVIIK